jgi:hypothetical protein
MVLRICSRQRREKEQTQLQKIRLRSNIRQHDRHSCGPALPENRRCKMMEMPFIDTVATGRNIDRLRIAAGMSVKDMQMVFGFATPQAIYKWIHGTSMPTIDNLVILAAMLGATLDEIVVVETAAMKCG